MKQVIILFLLPGTIFFTSCQDSARNLASQSMIKRLENAENLKEINSIESLLSEDIGFYTSELAPIHGREGVVSVYNYVFENSPSESVKYVVDTSYMADEQFIEQGLSLTRRSGQPPIANKFKAISIRKNGDYLISELFFGEEESIKRGIPELIKPTGDYQIGRTTRFYDKSISGNNRMLSFQIWYPVKESTSQKAVYQSKEVVEASAGFIGFPLFMISYFSQMESNAYDKATAYPDLKFPVVLYNHGYGGFTSVYQTVCEDLASHGYIVVSIAHEDESALLIKDDGTVIANDPENEIYTSRASELNGSAIGQWQSTILNSDDTVENRNAYQNLFKLSPLHNESTRLWQSDTKAVIEILVLLNNSDEQLRGAFDLESIGVFGHSVGGATAGQMGFGDDYIKAGINIDGFQFGDLINNHLKIPFMFISSNPEGGSYLRASAFVEDAKADCYHAIIEGFTHGSFSDLEYFLQGNERIIDLQRDLIRRFFDKYLKREEVELKDLLREYENLRID